MQNTTKQCPEIIGADTHGLADNTIGNQSLRMASIDIGGRCSFPINRYDRYNWKSIAPHGINRYWRAMQDSNPRLRLRRPEGYPDYPNRP